MPNQDNKEGYKANRTNKKANQAKNNTNDKSNVNKINQKNNSPLKKLSKNSNQSSNSPLRNTNKNNNQNNNSPLKNAGKQAGKAAAKAAINAVTGGVGGTVIDKVANSKIADKAIQKIKNNPAGKMPGVGGSMGSNNGSIFGGNRSLTKKPGSSILSGNTDNDENSEGSSYELESPSVGKQVLNFAIKHKNIILPILPAVIIIITILLCVTAVLMAANEDGSGNMREEAEASSICVSDSKLVDVASGEVGNNEANGTHAKYLQFLGFSPNTAWCAAFVSWCADQAGIDTSAIPHTASVSSFLEYFQKAGTFKSINSDYQPVAGNLIIWKAMGRSHIGIVKEYDSSKDILTTIEGNSSNAVRINTYTFSTLASQGVVGFANPQQQKCTNTADGDNATTIKNGQSITLPANLGTHGTREFDLATTSEQINYARSMVSNYRKIVNPYAFPENTSQRKVQDMWIKAGAKHDSNGFCKLDGRYLVATTTTFGSIGDKVDFYMSSGTIIHVILGDAKAQGKAWYDEHPADKWGHSNGKNVLEFMGKNSIGDNPYYTLGLNGQSVVKAVNGGSIFK